MIGSGLGFTYQHYDPGYKVFVTTDLTHNIVFDLLMRVGAIGLALFAIAFATTFVDGIKTWLERFMSEKPCDADQLNHRNPNGVEKVSTVPVASERYETALYMVGWSGCHSDRLVMAGVVWSNVKVFPASICC